MPLALRPVATASAAPCPASAAAGVSDADWSDALAQAQAPAQPPATSPATQAVKLAASVGAPPGTKSRPSPVLLKIQPEAAVEKPHHGQADDTSQPAAATHHEAASAALSPFAAMLLGAPGVPPDAKPDVNPGETAPATDAVLVHAHPGAAPRKNGSVADTVSVPESTTPIGNVTAKAAAMGSQPPATEGGAGFMEKPTVAPPASAVSAPVPQATSTIAPPAVPGAVPAHPAATQAPAPAAPATTNTGAHAQIAAHAAHPSDFANLDSPSGVASTGPAVIANTAQAAPTPLTATAAFAPANATAPAPSAPLSASGGVPATPSALAAAVTAMHQAGQASTILRLDPAGLGSLAVHVAQGAGGQINVLFVPTVAQTAQLLNANIADLRHAMAASGLNLGQAQVGGQSAGQSGQNHYAQGQRPASPPRITAAPEQAPDNGVRAYA